MAGLQQANPFSACDPSPGWQRWLAGKSALWFHMISRFDDEHMSQFLVGIHERMLCHKNAINTYKTNISEINVD